MSEGCSNIAILVLAAGLGKRMGLKKPKVLAELDNGPLIYSVLETAAALNPAHTVIVTGHGREMVESAVQDGAESRNYDLNTISFALQAEQKGTGDAVRCGLGELKDFTGTVLILYGDVPLLSPETLSKFLERHESNGATVSFISVNLTEPAAYGRVIRNRETGAVEKIVEAKDCTESQLLIGEINGGIYAVDTAFLIPAIEGLTTDNAQGELYLTDIVERAVQEGQTASVFICPESEELLGANTRHDLALLNSALRARHVRQLAESGVIFTDISTVYIDPKAKLSPGCQIGPNVQISGATEVMEGAVIEGSAFIHDSKIQSGALIKFGVRMEDAVVGPETMVGPFAHLRPGTVLGKDVKVGNFVETKKASLADGAKASHLTYLGDCKVGADANIGAGTITCNYDGYSKFETVIEGGAFIGSNSSLVAPVTIGEGATVGAGSVITKAVDQDDLAITRAPQRSVPGWSKKKREAHKKG